LDIKQQFKMTKMHYITIWLNIVKRMVKNLCTGYEYYGNNLNYFGLTTRCKRHLRFSGILCNVVW